MKNFCIIRLVLLFTILSLSWLSLSLAKSVPNTVLQDYDYPDQITIRMFPKLYRGKSNEDSDVSRPIQTYWQNIMRNITPFRWNMTNSLGNLFNAGAQQLMETPVAMHQDVERKRKRKNSKRRISSVKGSKSHRKSYSRGHSDIYNYAASNNPYSQMQLQPLGLDERNIMHFYEPKSGQYYALHMVSSPNQYTQQHYYTPQYSNYDTDDDSYYGEDTYANDHDHGHEHAGDDEHFDNEDDNEDENEDDNENSNEEDEEHDVHLSSSDNEYRQDQQNYDSEYDKVAEAASESGDDYADDVQVADNWGHTDADIFGERKLKLSLKNLNFRTKADNKSGDKNIIPSLIKLQNNLLKPETEEDVMLFLANNRKRNQRTHKPSSRPRNNEESSTSKKRIKPHSSKKSAEDAEIESVRNVLGSYMKDDARNRQIQSSATKQVKHRFVERPRKSDQFPSYPHYW